MPRVTLLTTAYRCPVCGHGCRGPHGKHYLCGRHDEMIEEAPVMMQTVIGPRPAPGTGGRRRYEPELVDVGVDPGRDLDPVIGQAWT